MAGGIISPKFVSNVCNNGLLGFIPGGYLNIQSLKEFIVTTKSLLRSNALFGVNIFIDKEQRNIDQVFKKSLDVIKIEHLLNINFCDHFTVHSTAKEDECIDLLIQQAVPIASCTFGFFNKYSVEKLKSNNIKIIGNATTLEEFKFCLEHGADAVVVQGTEAGGHQASFLEDTKNIKSTLITLEEIRKIYPHVVIIASGGISTKNMTNYFNSGANYVQLGTAFMMTYESSATDVTKKYIMKNQHTVLTDIITGKWARGIENSLTQHLQNNTYDFPIRHYETAPLRAKAKGNSNPEYLSLWAGCNPDNLEMMSLEQLLDNIKSVFGFRKL